MTLGDWVRESKYKIDAYGLRKGARSAAFDFWGGAARRFCHNLGLDTHGTPIYERDWDVLVLLDTCRIDALETVSDEFDFLPSSVPSFTSLGSTSWEWMHDNFTDEYRDEIAQTAYVTANPHTRRFGDEFPMSPDAFGLLDEVWEYEWDDDLSGNPPRPVTDRAISVARERDPERLIVHYMQPHAPYPALEEFAPEAARILANDDDRAIWDLLQAGQLPRSAAWSAYLENLRWVLEEVELLLSNMDADTLVVSSDHGEAFGEWGLYGHYRHVPIPVLKNVPWVELSATDSGEYEPAVEAKSVDVTDDDVEQRLSALGYK
ncbi:sulfatase-like hydrolase/transferase [Halorussus caseinilyticus]|uniref:sulfatase-like hydrolase/transferase n=1 Tax=Halorussus caseinilyticus TaxID=3034025 RepID=UPI0023E7930A|nr:sulfatase-like hydrolase/transferase [Halorussus sp. DT72]